MTKHNIHWSISRKWKVTDEQVVFINEQIKLINKQIAVLQKSKQNLFAEFWITDKAFYLRKKLLKL